MEKKDQYVLIGKGKFNLWANMAEVGLSNAGTATEQIAGLGIPSLSYQDLDHNLQNHLQKGNQDYWG